jgi:tripartite-type tricarboxylate transporter receptor subunit TctC
MRNGGDPPPGPIVTAPSHIHSDGIGFRFLSGSCRGSATMIIPRRRFLSLAAAATAAVSRPASALDYPARPVRVIDGFGGGSTPDLVSRLIGQWLEERLHQPFVVDNRVGAGGNIAAAAVAHSAPDGYTLLTCVTADAINATLYDKLDFDFPGDFAPVAGVIQLPMVLLVNPSFPAKTLAEFIAYAKANPGKINFASPGVGTPMHVAIELLKMQANIDVVHVPYRGPAPAFTDLLAGQVQAFIITLSTAIGFIRAGKLIALAVTSKNRADVLPNVAAVSEVLPGFDATAWDGVCAPKGTPPAIVEALSGNITAGLADPGLVAKVKDLGGETEPMDSAEFAKFLANETAKWAKVVKFANMHAD